jgi:signal transduction histidine kinase
VAVISIAWLAIVPLLLFPPLLLLVGIPIGALERLRLGFMEPRPVPDPHAPAPPSGWAWVRRRVTEAATWRELGYCACLLSVLALLDLAAVFVLFICLLLLALPLLVGLGADVHFAVGTWTVETVGQACAVAGLAGVPATVVTLYGISVLGGAQATFAKWLLTPTGTEMNRQVEELARSRSRLVNSFEAERRRIERDLHDGAQQRIVSVCLDLKLAAQSMDDGADPQLRETIAAAALELQAALSELRELARGIHPAILTEEGLGPALQSLTERARVPTQLVFDVPGRLRPTAEATAYFVASEALANVAKHAQATCAVIDVKHSDGRLRLEVADDGVGGADVTRGSGLRGLVDRVGAVDGCLEVLTAAGQGTRVRAEIPCG